MNLPSETKEKSIKNIIIDEHTIKLPILKSDGMAGMSTTSGGQGVITEGQGSYPEFRKKKKKKKCKTD